MIKVEIYRKHGSIVKFVMDGHAGFSDGDDIVCAAASSVAWAVINGIENVAGIHCGYETRDGYLFFILPDDLEKSEQGKSDLLLDSFFMYIKELESQYPDYIKVTELEV